MPTTLNDPRPRTRTISLDLRDPLKYRISVLREQVQEADTGQVALRKPTRVIRREVTFDLDGTPHGDPLLLALLAPIQAAVEAMEAADIAAAAAG